MKTIRCTHHGPLRAYPKHRVPWEDVWIHWKGKPGRKTYHAAPCLICHEELIMDMGIHEQIRAEAPEERKDWYRDEDARMQSALDSLQVTDYAAYGEGGALTIITKARGIDRQEAERMMAWYLREMHNVKRCKFSWQREKTIVMPMGLGFYRGEG